MNFTKIKGTANHHLFRPLGKEVYWVRLYKSGKGRLERSLKTIYLDDARIKRDIEIANFLGEKPRFSSKTHLVEDQFPIFLELKRTTKAENTYLSMKNQWENHLRYYFGGFLLDEVTETSWLQYVAEKRKESADRKFFNDRKYLSMFLHWAHRDGLIEKLPKLPDVDPEIAEGLVYTPEQIQDLLNNSNTELKLQILCAYTMGMRIGEIMSLEWSQIDFRRNTIYLPAHKTKIRKERTFGISSVCADLLLSYRQMSQGGAVFASPLDPDLPQRRDGNKGAWARCKANAGVPDYYHFHWLRHSFLTNAFKKSVNPALICKYAGLSLEEAQKTYLHFTVEDTRIVSTLVEVPV